MKKILVLLMVLVMVLGTVACQKEPTQPQSMDIAPTTAAAAETTAAAQSDESPLAAPLKALFNNMPEHVNKIDQKEFVGKVAAGEKLMIVDIRSAEDYGKGHVKGAVNLPWGTAISDNLSKLPQDQDVMVYCYTGQTAGQAVITMSLAGIKARSVNLGWNFGISKVEGIDAVTETTANELADAKSMIDPAVQEAVSAYYAGLATIADPMYKNYKISEADLKAMLDAGKKPFILSVRGAEDYAKAHIDSAINIPFGKTTLDDLSALPKDEVVHVYCYTGQTAGQVVAALRLMGYDAVSLNGGMGMPSNHPQGWANNGFPTVSTSPLINAVKNYFREMPEHVYKIDQKEFVSKVVAGEKMFILDIRSAEDYGKGHVKGAVNLPWGTAISDSLAMIPQDQDVMVYCYTGQTAGQAVVTLNIAGITARSVNLGWNFGISKVEGVAQVTETTANPMPTQTYTVDAEIAKAVADYYAGLATIEDARFKNYKVSEDDLKAMIDNKEDFFLLSVRGAEDYAKGHIQGAVNVPFNKATIDSLAMGKVSATKKVVVYCYTGQTAGQVVAAMRLLGYDAVSLNGGAGMPSNVPQGWTNAGYELVTE
jgi:rhodanese-related sulfurtransferase